MTLILCKTDTLMNSGRILAGFTPQQMTEWGCKVTTKWTRSSCHRTIIPFKLRLPCSCYFKKNYVVVLNLENAHKSSADINLGEILGKYLILNHRKLMKSLMILLYLLSSHIGTKLKNNCKNIISTSSNILLILVPHSEVWHYGWVHSEKVQTTPA